MPKPHLLDETSFSPCYVDRNGKLLRLGLAEDDRYRVYVPLEKISPQLVEMTLLHEDRYFHEHAGFNPLALARAAWADARGQGRLLGASTITMQLARLHYHLNTRTVGGQAGADRGGDSSRVPLLEARNPGGLPESRALRAEHRGRGRGQPDLLRQGAGRTEFRRGDDAGGDSAKSRAALARHGGARCGAAKGAGRSAWRNGWRRIRRTRACAACWPCRCEMKLPRDLPFRAPHLVEEMMQA